MFWNVYVWTQKYQVPISLHEGHLAIKTSLECMLVHRWVCIYVNLFLCVTTGAYALHVSEDSSGCWSLLPTVFETVSFYSMLHIAGNLACELQKSLISLCHLTTEVDDALYGFWESEFNSTHALSFPELHTWCSKDYQNAANVAREKAPDKKYEGNGISNLFWAWKHRQ